MDALYGVSMAEASSTCYTPLCDGVVNCKECSNSTTCMTCHSGYDLVNNTCTCPDSRCVSCQVDNCESCSSNNTCSQCVIDYKLNGNNFCVNCPDTNCDECSSDGVCSECNSGFTLNEFSVCVKCTASNCEVCSSSSTKKCVGCAAGY